MSANVNGVASKLKTFQGQKFDDELGLNWISFKYRNYDPSIGRFFNVDPLAEQYAFNSTYAFQENKLGLGVELEGLELAKFFDDTWDAFNRVFVNPVRNNNKRNAKKRAIFGTPDRKGPTKNITGNYFGDALYNLVGGETFRKAFSGDDRAQGQLIMGGMVGLLPGPRATTGSSSTLTKLLSGADAADDLFKIVGKNGDDVVRYLDNMGAEAAFMVDADGGTMLMREGASVETLAEEVIHFNQFKKYGETYFLNNRTKLEIEAQDQLLKIGKEEGWSEDVMERFRNAKASWEKLLNSESKSGTGN